jgi:hypothetical protein
MTKLHRALCVPLFVAITFCAGVSSAATIYAKSGYPSDLQAAINKAKTGDTVVIPAGRFSFRGSVMAPDGIYIRGAATNFQIFNSRFTKFLRAGIEFQGDAGTRQGPQRGVIYGNEFIDNWYVSLGYGVAVDGSAST